MENDLDFVEVSDTVPRKVAIYGAQDGAYFYGSFIDFSERPSEEWLASFGLQEYVDVVSS